MAKTCPSILLMITSCQVGLTGILDKILDPSAIPNHLHIPKVKAVGKNKLDHAT